MRARVRSRTAGLVRPPVVRLRCAISKTRRAILRARSRTGPEPPQSARDHPHPIGQQRAVRRIVNVGFDDGGVHPGDPIAWELGGSGPGNVLGKWESD
jgi:hypothetical protein